VLIGLRHASYCAPGPPPGEVDVGGSSMPLCRAFIDLGNAGVKIGF